MPIYIKPVLYLYVRYDTIEEYVDQKAEPIVVF